jgi:hypothetical protein
LKTPDELEKSQSQCIPSNTTWIQSNASRIEPENNLVQLEDGKKVLKILFSLSRKITQVSF